MGAFGCLGGALYCGGLYVGGFFGFGALYTGRCGGAGLGCCGAGL